MSITYAELTTEVVANLEIDSTDLSRYQVVEKLNIAQLEIINILPNKWIANIIKTATFNMPGPATEDNRLFQWPDDFVRFVQAWISYDGPINNLNRGQILYEWIAENHHKTIFDIATTLYPMINIQIEGGFEIWPAPADPGVLDGGALRYVWRPPAIALSGPQPSLLDYNLKPLLVHRGTQLSALVDNYRPELSANMKELYKEDLANFLPKKEPR